MRPAHRARRSVLAAAGSLLVLSGLLPVAAAAPAFAAPTELFFSEYIEGSSNNKALEIYNGTGTEVNLGTAGYNVQMFFNGNPLAGLTIDLTGSVAGGDVYVLAQAAASTGILDHADQTNGAGWFNGDDAVVLRRGSTIIDVIGQIGFDPGTEWGTGATSTADNTLERRADVEAGDPMGSDAFDPTVQWDGLPTDTFGRLGVRSGVRPPADTAPSVTSVVPANGAGNVDPTTNITVTFSEAVNATEASFTLVCTTTGAHQLAVTGGPTSWTLDPTTDLGDNESCTLTVLKDQVSDVDTADPPNTMAADFTATFSMENVCTQAYTRIPAIQGSGSSAATPGNVTTQGVVVGDFEGTAGLSGFYLQDATGDGNAETSDGIFVFTGSADTVAAGDVVRVTGYARERFNQTAINGSNSNTAPVTNIVDCGTGTVAPTDVQLPFSTMTSPERYEGMLVRLPQSLVISEYFNYDRFGELVLALPLPGEDRPYTPTSIVEPGAAAQARAQQNFLRRITLDDGLSVSNPNTVRHPNGQPFSLTNRFRGGDRVTNTVGVVGFDFNLYRIQPTAPAEYTAVNVRPPAPQEVGGSLRAAAMNTLNFFLTLDTTSSDSGPGPCGGNQNLDCRGADAAEPTEFGRQRDKLIAALAGLDADVIGLNELENTPGVDPLGDPERGIVAGLNGVFGSGTYAAIDTGVIGTDAIRVGLIYRPAAVRPVGPFRILTSAVDPRFVDTLSRPVLAQTFEEVATGARFTVAVNHLKSKGSACAGDPDTGDGQGNCNLTRTNAAKALVDWLATDPTNSGDRDYLILGDLNAYAKEDPIDAILAGPDDAPGTADDYTNLILRDQGTYAYSYVFDGQAGYLDHAIASPTLAAQVTKAADWHINADEPDILDYDTSFKSPGQDTLYERNAYRSSDHDPVVVGLDLLSYAFDGFRPPVANPTAVNRVNAGAAVPLKFDLADGLGLDVLFGTPTTRQVTCGTLVPSGQPTSIATVEDRGLQQDPVTGQYTVEWKTLNTWAGECRDVELTFDDGAYRRAYFRFR